MDEKDKGGRKDGATGGSGDKPQAGDRTVFRAGGTAA